jgi:Tfp pilus assembly protein PilN
MPYKGGVQLLPETQRRPTLSSYTSGNSYFYFAIFLGAIILVASATLGSYKANLSKEIESLTGKMNTREKMRNKEQEKELVAAAKQSKVLQQVLANKIYWTQAFDRIEKIMQSTVTLTGLDANFEKGTITFKATADSYASVARQLASFTAASGITDVSVDKIDSSQAGSVEFTGSILVDTKAMLLKSVPKATPKP